MPRFGRPFSQFQVAGRETESRGTPFTFVKVHTPPLLEYVGQLPPSARAVSTDRAGGSFSFRCRFSGTAYSFVNRYSFSDLHKASHPATVRVRGPANSSFSRRQYRPRRRLIYFPVQIQRGRPHPRYTFSPADSFGKTHSVSDPAFHAETEANSRTKHGMR